MSNTLTSLVPDLYEAVDVVSRELVGFIPSVTLMASAERAALNQTIRVPITPGQAAQDISPGQLPPNNGFQTIGNNSLSITKSRMVPFTWNGEEEKGINTEAPNGGMRPLLQQQIQQALRTLTNEIDSFVGALYPSASRAYGASGTPLFSASDLSSMAQLKKIMEDNGAPEGDLHAVLDTGTTAALRSTTQYTKANEAGTVALREQGILQELFGFQIRGSAGVARGVSVGTVSGTVTASGSAGVPGAPVVSVSITVAAGGTFAVLAGDVLSFAGDPNKYVVAAASTIAASSSGTVTIALPGLLTTISGAAVTIAASGNRSMAFARSAIALAIRQPALPTRPDGTPGDMATDRITIVDPRSGIPFEFAMYEQYRQIHYEVGVAYGASVIKPEHVALALS